MKKTLIATLLCSFIVSLFAFPKSHPSNFTTDFHNEQVLSHYKMDSSEVNSLFDELASLEPSSIYDKEQYSSYYFNNLRTNFGNNLYGTCSYVSIGMLLSFYDSYWDDSIISENYDVKAEFVSNYQPGADFELIPSNTDSPGIRFEPYSFAGGLNIEDYYQLITNNKQTYFQFKLIDLAMSIFGDSKFDGSDDSLGMSQTEIISLLSSYLYNIVGKTTNQISIDSISSENDPYFEYHLKQKINSGVPVILRAKESNGVSGHSMIAYDYDYDEIYVHTGWRDEITGTALTHVALSDLPFDDLLDATFLTIKPGYTHSHAFNYHSTSGSNLCACSFVYPREIEIEYDEFYDSIPYFKWMCLGKEKWFSNYNIYYELSLLDSQKHVVCSYDYLNNSLYYLSQEDWDSIIFNTNGSKYYVEISIDSNSNLPYADEYWCLQRFNKPFDYLETPYILPSEYGFADAYPSDWTTANVFTSHTAHNNSSFQTKRYRTGYIHNEYVVLSPIRQGFNEAYIEYKFQYPVNRIDVALSHWRSPSYEHLTNSNGMAQAQALIRGEWVCMLDLLSSSTNLPIDRANARMYKISFPNAITSFRIIARTYTTPTNNDNRGRICIGKLAYYDVPGALPLSGYEVQYNPSVWDMTWRHNNCYAYALNNQVDPRTNEIWDKQQPGEYAGIDLNGNYSKAKITYAVSKDFEKYSRDSGNTLTFMEVGKYTVCPQGTYKVALVSYSGDYHWYRQDADGYWSHKQGRSPISRVDCNGDLIIDPETCDRGSYVNFLGFYAVSPWNNLYSNQ